MNRPIESFLLPPADEAARLREGARVGISRPHESAHLHVAGEATYTDDILEAAGTLHAADPPIPLVRGRLRSAPGRHRPGGRAEGVRRGWQPLP